MELISPLKTLESSKQLAPVRKKVMERLVQLMVLFNPLCWMLGMPTTAERLIDPSLGRLLPSSLPTPLTAGVVLETISDSLREPLTPDQC